MLKQDYITQDRKRKALGKTGEDMACRLLEEKGYTVVSRNYRGGHKEIDIICLDGCDLRFVEVKTRQLPMEGEPWEAVDGQKQRNIALAARSFLRSGEFRELGIKLDECHFDVVSIVWDESGSKSETEYIPDAFYLIYT